MPSATACAKIANNLCASQGTLHKTGAAPQHPAHSLWEAGAVIRKPCKDRCATPSCTSHALCCLCMFPVPPLPCQSAPLPARAAPAWWSTHNALHTPHLASAQQPCRHALRSQALPCAAKPCAAARETTFPAPARQGVHTKTQLAWVRQAQPPWLFPARLPAALMRSRRWH